MNNWDTTEITLSESNRMVVSAKINAAINDLVVRSHTCLSQGISNDESAATANEIAKDMKGFIKAVETARKSYTARLDAQKKAMIAQERDITAPVNEACQTLLNACGIYMRQREEERRREEERIRKAAEEAQRALEEAKRAEEEQKRLDAHKAEAAAKFGIAAPVVPTVSTEVQKKVASAEAAIATVSAMGANAMTKNAGGMSVRTSWAYKVTDPESIPRQYMMIDDRAIKNKITSLKNSHVDIKDVHIPGIEVFEKTTIVNR